LSVTLRGARVLIDRGELDGDNAFDVLAAVARGGAVGNRDQARELLIRLLARRDEIAPGADGLLQALVREHGLYPYLRDVVALPVADRLAYEAHRPDNMPDDQVVFHSEQALVYERLLAGENVVLSAPTSFGKSLVVDAILARQDFRNAAVVVPTIALMDECRRRLSRLDDKYKIVTHGSQILGERNLIVMTQERLLELGELPPLDFFVIDEFYKLDPAHSDERSNRLNILFRRLLDTGAQYYLLGPNITAISPDADSRLRATFISTAFTTVATDIERVNATKDELPAALAQACREAGPGTLVYCKSPARTREVAQWLLDAGVGGGIGLDDAADWVGEAYHPGWIVARALRTGIGIHHGRIPRALGHHLVRLFNEGRLPYLLVTSTLIEGVNTTARTVIVLDNKIANRKYDYFTFSNIRGRSGRMFRHYIGRVVVFNPEPTPADLNVDIPALSQKPGIADEILIQLPEAELTAASRDRLDPYRHQQLVRLATLRDNVGVSPARQVEVAEAINAQRRRWRGALEWNTAFPTVAQVRDLGELLFTITGPGNGVRTARQLGARINMLRYRRGDLNALAADDIQRGTPIDDAVESALDFARNWAQFKIPTALTAVAAVARDVLGRDVPSDPGVFAGELENLFLPPFLTVLEEYGLPTHTSLKLERQLQSGAAENLDDVLARLRGARPTMALGPFEQEMLRDTQQSL
jgi:rhodanese-related sulfurtransferase